MLIASLTSQRRRDRVLKHGVNNTMNIKKLCNMKTTKLENLRACRDAIEWVGTRKSPKDAWMNCERGDWMLWIAKRLDVDDRILTLAKVKCVEQIRHLMKDQRSLDALDACYRYAKGEITREELNLASAAADAAYASDAASAAAAYAAASYAYASAAASYAYASAAASAAAARMKSLKKSADICREILTEEVLRKYKNAKIK
jgi:hypothetical protein